MSTYISYIDPDSCEEFLRTYSLKWLDSEEPHVAFVTDFARQYMPSVSCADTWHAFNTLMSGPRIDDLSLLHAFLCKVRASVANVRADYFADAAECERLQGRVSLDIVGALVSSLDESCGFHDWLTAIEKLTVRRMRQIGTPTYDGSGPVSHSPSVSFALPSSSPSSQSFYSSSVGSASLPVGDMDIDAITARVIAAFDKNKRNVKGGGRSSVECWGCGKKGHFRDECPKEKGEGKGSSSSAHGQKN